ncbi:MAG TPA: ABC transporter permease [Gemmataceae bacterium]|nr:ABC transporter permease [Gemmataceae bacterium]
MASRAGPFQATRGILNLLARHRQLTWVMAKREVGDRYAGQMLGLCWAIGHPLLLMGVYLFVFAVVVKMKLGGTYEMPLDYTTYLLAGLIPWMSFQEVMNKAPVTMTANASLVKQVVFPLEVLPAKGVLAALFTQGICLAILVGYVLLSHHALPWTYALLPLLVLLQVVGMCGVSYALCSIGAYVRDLKDVVQVFCIIGVYLMPIFYLPNMVPRTFRPALYVNPFSYLVWCYQDLCYYGRFEHPWAWAVLTVLSFACFYGGYRLFQRLKPYFGNVL